MRLVSFLQNVWRCVAVWWVDVDIAIRCSLEPPVASLSCGQLVRTASHFLPPDSNPALTTNIPDSLDTHNHPLPKYNLSFDDEVDLSQILLPYPYINIRYLDVHNT